MCIVMIDKVPFNYFNIVNVELTHDFVRTPAGDEYWFLFKVNTTDGKTRILKFLKVLDAYKIETMFLDADARVIRQEERNQRVKELQPIAEEVYLALSNELNKIGSVLTANSVKIEIIIPKENGQG